MAAKDFVTRFLSDLTRWRVADAADDLDDVASSADKTERSLADVEDAGRQAGRGLDDVASAARDADGDLERVGEGAKEAGREVDAAGDDADSAAERIADAFRKIKKSSDDDLGGIGEGAKKGTREVSEATQEMGGEVREELVSMAGSFDGTFESAADSAQALTSAIAQSLGPLGVGIGAGLALGIGIFRSGAERAKEAVNALTERVQELASGTSDVDQVTKEWLDGVEDRGKTLRQLSKDSDLLGVSIETLARAHAGDSDAIDEVTEASKRYTAQLEEDRSATAAMIGSRDALGTTQNQLSKSTKQLGDDAEAAAAQAQLYNEAIGATSEVAEAARERQEAYGQSLSDFIDPATIYTDTLQTMAQATADKTKDQKDSWEDYADQTAVSLDKVNEGLRKQVEAQEAWATNMAKVAERASDETLAYLRELGPSGAGLVKELANASDEQMAEFESLMKRRSEAGVANVATAIDNGTAAAVLAAQRQQEAIAAVYSKKITQMIEVKADPRSISLVRQEAAMAANGAAQGAARSRS